MDMRSSLAELRRDDVGKLLFYVQLPINTEIYSLRTLAYQAGASLIFIPIAFLIRPDIGTQTRRFLFGTVTTTAYYI